MSDSMSSEDPLNQKKASQSQKNQKQKHQKSSVWLHLKDFKERDMSCHWRKPGLQRDDTRQQNMPNCLPRELKKPRRRGMKCTWRDEEYQVSENQNLIEFINDIIKKVFAFNNEFFLRLFLLSFQPEMAKICKEIRAAIKWFCTFESAVLTKKRVFFWLAKNSVFVSALSQTINNL